MKRWMTLAFALILAPTAHADYRTSTFEDLGLAPNSYNDNAGSTGQFVSGGVSFGNSNNGGFDHGFVISSLTKTTPADYTNPYAAVTGIGGGTGPVGNPGSSATYAVGFTYGSPAFSQVGGDPSTAAYQSSNPFHPSDTYITLTSGQSPVSIQITNTAYTYAALKNGSPGFTTPFAQGDFDLLDVRGYSANGTLLGDVPFYLADYRSTNPANWYIVNTWTTVDLSKLAGATTLQFGITSSQNDSTFGDNEPAYFAADNFTFSSNAVPEPASVVLLSTGLIVVSAVRRLRRTRIDA